MTVSDLAAIANLFPKAKQLQSGEYSTCCPVHETNKSRPSMSLGIREGQLVVRCHGGCNQRDVFDAVIGRAREAGLMPNGEDRSAKRNIVATYDYTDAAGRLVFQVVRFAPKDFRQRRPDGNGGWIWNIKGVERVPYRLPEVVNASEIYVTEGEKDANHLRTLGLTATCNPGGADKWPETFARWFEGRHVVILPDNDDQGRDHARDVAHKLHDTAASIKIVELPDLPPKGDVSDWINAGGTVELLQELAAAEAYWEARHDEQQARPNGNPNTEAFPFVLLRELEPNLTSNEIVRDLIPRNALIEAHAAAGGGKTAIIVDLALHIADGRAYRNRRVEQQPVVYIALEGHGGIDNRVIAARDELEITDAPFALVKATDNFRDPEPAHKAAALARKMAQDFGGTCPVIVIDTYTAALGAGGNDCDPKDVTAFIENIKTHLLGGCTVVLNHHFGKDASRGGRGWSGLNAALDVELEIDRDDELRTMRVTKSRDGSDAQPAFCYRFHARELGTNNYGEPVTAVVVEHLADEDTAKHGKRLSHKSRAALNKLWDCIKDPSRSWPLSESPRLKCTMVDVWEKACIEPGGISQATRDCDRRKVFAKAKDELLSAGAIVCDGPTKERVYPTPKDRDNAGAE